MIDPPFNNHNQPPEETTMITPVTRRRCRLAPTPIAAALLMLAGGHAAAADLVPAQVEIGDLSLRLNGRAQQDFLIDADVPAEDQDGGELRRARIGLRARYGKHWRGGVSLDIDNNNDTANNTNNGDVILRDASVEYTGFPVRVELGRFQEPFGLASYGSSRSTVFMERPSPTQFGPDYGLGGALNYRGKRYGVTVGAFTKTGGEFINGDRPEDALTGRITVNPLRGDYTLLHLGVSGSLRQTGDPRGLRIQGSPETVLVGGLTPRSPRVASANAYSLYNGEAAIQAGALLLQAEYIVANGEDGIGGDGWYVEGSWALTGERRDYSTRNGNFGGIDPRRPLFGSGRNGWGALEIGARYSDTALTDGGGDQGRVYGAALNWYPHEHIRLSLNYLRVSRQRFAEPKEEADVIQTRLQVSF